MPALFADTVGIEGQLLADETATAEAIRDGLSALATAADDDIVVITTPVTAAKTTSSSRTTLRQPDG